MTVDIYVVVIYIINYIDLMVMSCLSPVIYRLYDCIIDYIYILLI